MNEPMECQTHASEYLSVIRDAWPLVAICFATAFFWGLRKIKNGYKMRNITGIIGNLIFTSLSAMVLGFGSVLLLPYFYPETTPSIEIGVGVLVSIFGQKIIDIVLVKKFGLTTLDLMDKEDMDSVRNSMGEHDKMLHARQCPFKSDMDDLSCHNCETCHHKMNYDNAKS